MISASSIVLKFPSLTSSEVAAVMRGQTHTLQRVSMASLGLMSSLLYSVTPGTIFRQATAVVIQLPPWVSGLTLGEFDITVYKFSIFSLSMPEGSYFFNVNRKAPFAMDISGNGC